jgi:hypothetical protein
MGIICHRSSGRDTSEEERGRKFWAGKCLVTPSYHSEREVSCTCTTLGRRAEEACNERVLRVWRYSAPSTVLQRILPLVLA